VQFNTSQMLIFLQGDSNIRQRYKLVRIRKNHLNNNIWAISEISVAYVSDFIFACGKESLIHCCSDIYSTVLKRLATPSDFLVPLPTIVPFAHSETPFTHCCTTYIPSFQVLRGRPRFILSSGYPVGHIFGNCTSSILSTCPYQMSCISGYVIQFRILRVHLPSNILIHFFYLNYKSLLIRYVDWWTVSR
jgi:hypothetical protein